MSYREIENGDLPAYPTPYEEKTDQYAETPSSMIKSEGGLTKREMFAMNFMVALLGRDTATYSEPVAKVAMQFADSLLKEIESDKLSKQVDF